jgi:HEAT repeat protein
MLKFCKLVPVLLFIFFSSGPVFSQDSAKAVSKITDEDIEINYLAGVKTANLGLKVSAAYYLGERKSQRSVIPLMNMLHTDTSPEARIMAALSLYKIGDERGIYAIQRAADFDDNEQVKKMCKILYDMYEIELQQKK